LTDFSALFRISLGYSYGQSLVCFIFISPKEANQKHQVGGAKGSVPDVVFILTQGGLYGQTSVTQPSL
jgi:hypothetical protein